MKRKYKKLGQKILLIYWSNIIDHMTPVRNGTRGSRWINKVFLSWDTYV